MKSDFYTKFILTIIAISLVILVLKDTNIITPVNASPAFSNSSSSETVDVNIVSINGNSTYYGLKVSVENTPTVKIESLYGLDVNIKNTPTVKIDDYSAIDVNVKNTPTVKVDDGGGLDVYVKNTNDFK